MTRLVGGATAQLRQLFAQCREIDVFYCTRRINASEVDFLYRVWGAPDRQHEPEPKHLPIGLEPDLKQLQTAFTVREDEPGSGSLLRDYIRHRGLRHHRCNRFIGTPAPPNVK